MAILDPWRLPAFTGIDNVHDLHNRVFQGNADGSAPVAVRSALEIDFDAEGMAHRRQPWVDTAALTSGEGLFSIGGRLFYQDDGTLYEDDTALVTGLTQRMVLCEHGGLIYGTDGTTQVEIDGTTVRNWGLPYPGIALAAAAGSIASGTYLIQASFVDARGNEGGTSDIASITLSGVGAIEVTVSGETADVTHVNLYAGHKEQETTSFVAKVAIASFPYTITDIAVTVADPPRTEQMTGPPTGAAGICSFRAFMMLWRDNIVFRSEGGEPHLYHGERFMAFNGTVYACEAPGLTSGLWVGTDVGLYWVGGENPEDWVPRRITQAPVAQGSCQVQGGKFPALQTSEMVALFVTADGLVAGLPGGTVVHLTDGRYSFDTAQRASFAYVQRGDLRQLFIGLVEA